MIPESTAQVQQTAAPPRLLRAGPRAWTGPVPTPASRQHAAVQSTPRKPGSGFRNSLPFRHRASSASNPVLVLRETTDRGETPYSWLPPVSVDPGIFVSTPGSNFLGTFPWPETELLGTAHRKGPSKGRFPVCSFPPGRRRAGYLDRVEAIGSRPPLWLHGVRAHRLQELLHAPASWSGNCSVLPATRRAGIPE